MITESDRNVDQWETSKLTAILTNERPVFINNTLVSYWDIETYLIYDDLIRLNTANCFSLYFKFLNKCLGGWDGSDYLDDILEFIPSTGEWSLVNRMTQGREFHAVSIIDFEIDNCTIPDASSSSSNPTVKWSLSGGKMYSFIFYISTQLILQ